MATRIFPWGRVSNLPNGEISVFLSPGLKFDLFPYALRIAVDCIEGNTPFCKSRSSTTGRCEMEWDPYPSTPKSVLKVDRGAGTTTTILSYDEAMELVDALRVLGKAILSRFQWVPLKPVQTAP